MKTTVLTANGVIKAIGEDPDLQSDAAQNDSDKTLTVPAGKIWEIQNVYIKLVTTATAGNRLINLQVLKADDTIILNIRAGLVQAASLTYHYVLGQGLPHTTTVAQLTAFVPLPQIVIPAGYKIRILDVTAVDAAADDMDIHAMVEEIATSV